VPFPKSIISVIILIIIPMDYRRIYNPGGTYFFTVVTHLRRKIFDHPSAVELLRNAFQYVQQNHPFKVISHVILPDHIHMIWTLPRGDSNYPARWRLIKGKFSRDFPSDFLEIPMSDSRLARGESSIWQRRYWEHTIRDECDLENHINYIHINPVKHGYVIDPFQWELSSIRKFETDHERTLLLAQQKAYDLMRSDM
jgi:putative transposase